MVVINVHNTFAQIFYRVVDGTGVTDGIWSPTEKLFRNFRFKKNKILKLHMHT